MARYEINNIPGEIDFECVRNGEVARVLQNAKNLLMTRKGEIPYDRQRGFDASLFDLPKPELDAALLPELDRVMLWEPRAEVVSATAELTPYSNVTVIRCVIEV